MKKKIEELVVVAAAAAVGAYDRDRACFFEGCEGGFVLHLEVAWGRCDSDEEDVECTKQYADDVAKTIVSVLNNSEQVEHRYELGGSSLSIDGPLGDLIWTGGHDYDDIDPTERCFASVKIVRCQ